MPGVSDTSDGEAVDSGPSEAALQPRGSSQTGVRQYNERVVLEAVRLHGQLPAADIARQTQLTAQTVSLITKRLLDDQLLAKGEPQRGRVGQPSVPLRLNPEGAYAIGVKLGRRSLDVLLVDLTGRVVQRHSLSYRHADPAAVLAEIGRRLADIQHSLSPGQWARVQGIGVAAPLAMGGWQQLLGLPAPLAERWRQLDLSDEIAALTALPVTVLKDTAAACVAELVAGRGRQERNFLYVFVDTFVGGGLVLDGRWRAGVTGNAGAIGSLPLGLAASPDSPPAQLLSTASLLTLETLFIDTGLPAEAAADERAMQSPWWPQTQRWLATAAPALAQAVQSAACLLDIEAVVVDGSFSRGLQQALIEALGEACTRYSWEGVTRPRLVAGSIGSDARALGGALLPLYASFSPDRGLFLKPDA